MVAWRWLRQLKSLLHLLIERVFQDLCALSRVQLRHDSRHLLRVQGQTHRLRNLSDVVFAEDLAELAARLSEDDVEGEVAALDLESHRFQQLLSLPLVS